MKIDKMTDDEKRIRIAEACGWKEIHERKAVWMGEEGAMAWCGRNPTGKGFGYIDGYDCIPEYLSNLDSIHNAEAIVKHNDAYWATLLRIVEEEEQLDWRKMNNIDGIRIAGTASARQRSNAFLLTLP